MYEEKLQETIRNYEEQIAEFRCELSKTHHAPTKFELRKKIEECKKEIEKINQEEFQKSIPKRKLIEFKSEVGVNYTRLQDLLAAQNWKEADAETHNLMLKAINKVKLDLLLFGERERFRKHEADTFPCTDLLTIDRLWCHYSKGHFGYSVQKRIYEKLGGTIDYNEKIWEKFGYQVGWRVEGKWIPYGDYKFSLNGDTKIGHLPSCINAAPQNVFQDFETLVMCLFPPSAISEWMNLQMRLFYRLEFCSCQG